MTTTTSLSAAMASAFHEIEGAEKGRTNPHFKSKYADLSSVTDAIKPALVKHGLWYRQVMHNLEGGVGVETVIHHASGESLSCGVIYVPASKNDAQGYGSAITYARRYSLQAAFGVCPEDDDGNAAAASKRKADEKKPDDDVPAIAPERARIVRKVADECIAAQARQEDWSVYENACGITDNDEKLVLWAMLKEHSAVRATIKRMRQIEQQQEKAAA